MSKRLARCLVFPLCFALFTVLTFLTPARASDKKLTVFAAASMTNALNELNAAYEKTYGVPVTASYASSSTLAKQIESGAPADVFLSANKEWMDYLAERKLLLESSRKDIVGNNIVLIAPAASPLGQVNIVPGMALADLLGKDGRLAVGDPSHVPVGMYGKAALQKLKCWDQVAQRLAPTKDVRAALTLVERDEAPLGLVYASDAVISSKVKVVAVFPKDSHPGIEYPVAALAGKNTQEAERYIAFLSEPASAAVFKKYGFEQP